MVIKECSCGRALTRNDWEMLEHLPDWDFGDGEVVQEVRNCACGSTLMVDRIDAAAPMADPPSGVRWSATSRAQVADGLRSCRIASRLTSSPFPMLLLDGRSGAVLDANEAAVRATGWSREEILDASVSDFLPPSGSESAPYLPTLSGSTHWTGPWAVHRRDGSTFVADLGAIEAPDAEYPTLLVMLTPQRAPEMHTARAVSDHAR
jgi:PAS domain S-box-containing protein